MEVRELLLLLVSLAEATSLMEPEVLPELVLLPELLPVSLLLLL